MKALFALVILVAGVLLGFAAIGSSIFNLAELEPAAAEQVLLCQGNARLALLALLGVAGMLKLLSFKLRYAPYSLMSEVPEHEGMCHPVWVNTNRLHYMQTGAFTGFFRRAFKIGRLPLVWLTGPQFHGYVRGDTVKTTENVYGRVPA